MPFHVAVEKPYAGIVCAEAELERAVTVDHNSISSHRCLASKCVVQKSTRPVSDLKVMAVETVLVSFVEICIGKGEFGGGSTSARTASADHHHRSSIVIQTEHARDIRQIR